jgi:hypothetical protein
MGNNPDGIGGFTKGVSGNPSGRPKKEREVRYYEIMQTNCSFSDWKDITAMAVKQAKRGDPVARKWLSDNLMGKPELTIDVNVKQGAPFEIRWSDSDETDI